MILNSAPINHASVNSVARWILSLQVRGNFYVSSNAINYLESTYKGIESKISASTSSNVFLTLQLNSVPVTVNVASSSNLYKLYADFKSFNNFINVSSLTGNLYNYSTYNPTTSTLGIRNTSYLSPTSYFAGTPSRFNVSSLDSKYILEARMASNASINTTSYDSKLFLETFFRSLDNTVSVQSAANNTFYAKFYGKPSFFFIDENSKVYTVTSMKGTSTVVSIDSLAEEYQILTLSNFVHEEKAYIVEPIELNYYVRQAILAFHL